MSILLLKDCHLAPINQSINQKKKFNPKSEGYHVLNLTIPCWLFDNLNFFCHQRHNIRYSTTSQYPSIFQRTKPKYFTTKSSNVRHLLVETLTSPRRKYDFSLSNVRQFFCKILGLCHRIKGMVVEFFMLSRRFSDGISCWSYRNLVGRRHRSSENRRDVVNFVMSSHQWSNH